VKFTPEFVVGLIALGCIALIVGITFQLQNFDVFSSQYRVYARFDNSRGLEAGAPVHVNGVPVGKVMRVERVENKYPVLVAFNVPKDVDLYDDSKIRISTSGMLGDMFLDVWPGNEAKNAKIATSDFVFIGKPSVELDRLLDQTPVILADVAAIVAEVRIFLTDKNNAAAINNAIKGIGSITQRLDGIIQKGGPDVDASIRNIREMTVQMNALSERLNGFLVQLQENYNTSTTEVSSRFAELNLQVNAILKNVEQLTEETRKAVGQINTMVGENRPYIRDATRSVARAADNISTVTASVQSGHGTIGRLLVDPQPFDDLREILAELRAMLQGSEGVRNPVQYEQPPLRPDSKTGGKK
jgi:phospholipid/cholesterol/gamma-HCH transport system substrate-binding protein